MLKTSPVPLACLADTISCWDFVIYRDSEAESVPLTRFKEDGDTDLKVTPEQDKSFEIKDRDNCILYLYSHVETCQGGADFEDFEENYDFGDERPPIAPGFD